MIGGQVSGGMEAPWTLARPDLRFEFRPAFLEVASSPAKMTEASRRLRRARPRIALDHSIKQVSSPPISKVPSAASIARATEVFRDEQRSKAIEKIHQLRELSAAMRGKRDEEKIKRKEMRKLLSDIRRKCFFRLQQLNNPMRGHIMRALNQDFVLHLLQHYDGYSLSVDAILRLIGVFDGLSAPHTLRSDEILRTCGFGDTDVEEAPPSAPIRPPSPIQLRKGVGFRVMSPPEGKEERSLSMRKMNSLEMIPNTVVMAPARRKEDHLHGKHLLLDRGGSLGMNFSGSDFGDSPFMVPMKPYSKNTHKTESLRDDNSSMGFPTPLQRFQLERELFMDSIDSRGGSIIVMQEKFSNRTNRIELSLHRKKDLRGLWRPKTLTKQSLRPFVSTT